MFFFTLLAVTASMASAGQLGYPAHASCKADWWVMGSEILGLKRAEGEIYDIGKPQQICLHMPERIYLKLLGNAPFRLSPFL